MSKPYSILREKMEPAAREKAAEETKSLLRAMPLQELRHARNLSQEQLAQTLYRSAKLTHLSSQKLTHHFKINHKQYHLTLSVP